MNHEISVVIPNKNMGEFLTDAVSSILRQKHPVHEIIIIDSQSNDDSVMIAASLRARGAPVRFIEVEPATPSCARNLGIAAARGDVIGFVDADDLWPQDKLERQLARLDADPHVDVVAGYTAYFDKLDRSTLAPASDSRIEKLFQVCVGSAIYRRSIFDKVGVFDSALLYAEDNDLWLRLVEAEVALTILPIVSLYYRGHANSLMAMENPRRSMDFGAVLMNSLRRRRANGTIWRPLRDMASFVET